MGHCGGGAGPADFGQPGHHPSGTGAEHDILTALDRWVERGIAPRQFIASRMVTGTRGVGMTRPVCPYPEEPRWNGRGNPNDAGSFACAIRTPIRHAKS
jgi:feruloyl esterase